MSEEPEILTLTGTGVRLDVLVSASGLSRSRAAALIGEGCVTVNGLVIGKPSFKAPAGAEVKVTLPPVRDTEVLPENIPLSILYEDECLAVIEKPAGLVVHPAAGNESGTLVNALLYHLDALSGIGGERRPGIVHRLDKDTSGLMLVAKDDQAHLSLSAQLAARTMEKHYRAAVSGRMKEETGRIEKPIGRDPKDRKRMAVVPDGRYALTEWRVLGGFGPGGTLLDVHILTGRTHQIRVHMASIGHPVLGDPIYGGKHAPRADRLMLHACSLSFDHPRTGERMTFHSPAPFAPEEETP